MATAKTMWVTTDGKSFENKIEAEAHEFAQQTLRLFKVSRPNQQGSPYHALRFYYEREHSFVEVPKQE